LKNKLFIETPNLIVMSTTTRDVSAVGRDLITLLWANASGLAVIYWTSGSSVARTPVTRSTRWTHYIGQ